MCYKIIPHLMNYKLIKMKSVSSNNSNMGYSGSESNPDETADEAVTAMTAFQAREEEIERRKLEVMEKVQSQLGRAEEETKRLSRIWDELEVFGDPTRKDIANVRKKMDVANRELKSLGQSFQRKEKEYKEAMAALNEKNMEKAQLVTTLMELLNESERSRMKKLEELSKHMESIKS